MSYATKWSHIDVTKRLALQPLTNYGHLLKWKHYEETCLEVGCGEGTVTKQLLYPYIQNHIEKLVAIDKLGGMIHFAKEHNSHVKIEYQTMDILNDQMIATMHNQFDHIFSIFVSHLIPDTRSFLINLHRILKSNGQIFIITPVDNMFKQVSSDLCQDEKWLKHKLENPTFTDYTTEPVQYITDLLQEIGFKVDLCENDKRFVIIDNFEGFVIAIIDMYQNLGVIPSELLTVFYDEFLQKCREKCNNLGEPEKYDMPIEDVSLFEPINPGPPLHTSKFCILPMYYLELSKFHQAICYGYDAIWHHWASNQETFLPDIRKHTRGIYATVIGARSIRTCYRPTVQPLYKILLRNRFIRHPAMLPHFLNFV